MFSNDKNINDVSDLLREAYAYVDLRLQQLRLDAVGKLTVLLSAALVCVVMLVLMAVALFFAAYMFALLIAPAVGGLHWACGIVALTCVVIALVFYALRRRLILRPLANFLGNLLLTPIHKKEDPS